MPIQKWNRSAVWKIKYHEIKLKTWLPFERKYRKLSLAVSRKPWWAQLRHKNKNTSLLPPSLSSPAGGCRVGKWSNWEMRSNITLGWLQMGLYLTSPWITPTRLCKQRVMYIEMLISGTSPELHFIKSTLQFTPQTRHWLALLVYNSDEGLF